MDRTNVAQPTEQWVGGAFLYLYGVCMDGLRKTKRESSFKTAGYWSEA